jgi:hypothetical protein
MAAEASGGDLSPVSLVSGGISVVPSALGEAAGVARAVSASVHTSGRDLAAGSGWYAVGNAACADALSRAGGSLGQTLLAAGDGVFTLARALAAARDTYQVADAVAVPGASK